MLRKLSLAVVEPTYPVNIGHLARLAKNFGLHSLILIEPSFKIEEALPYASHGADILRNAKAMSLKEVFERFELVIGTTSIPGGSRNIKRDVISPEDAGKRISETSGSVCILLGRETTGLTNKELELCDLVISIPTGTTYRTLNISHAAAIILYIIYKSSSRKVKKAEVPRTMKTLLLDSAVELAELSGFPKYKVGMLRDSLKMLVGRGNPTHRELSLILGLLRKAILALKRRG
ncbi:MAG: TrmH family RNA methyltransferase [Nitrososphaerales archaeon]